MELSLKYFYAEGEEQIGPHSLAEIESKILDGKIKPDTKVWTKGMTDWLAAESIDAISGIFEEIPPPLSRAKSTNDETPPPLNIQKKEVQEVEEVDLEESLGTAKPDINENEIFSRKNPNWHDATLASFGFTGLLIIVLLNMIVQHRLELDLAIMCILQPVLSIIFLRYFYRSRGFNFRSPALTGFIINIIMFVPAAIITELIYSGIT